MKSDNFTVLFKNEIEQGPVYGIKWPFQKGLAYILYPQSCFNNTEIYTLLKWISAKSGSRAQ